MQVWIIFGVVEFNTHSPRMYAVEQVLCDVQPIVVYGDDHITSTVNVNRYNWLVIVLEPFDKL